VSLVMVEDNAPGKGAARVVHSPRGSELSCRNWQAEGALRMLHNNLDPDVAEHPGTSTKKKLKALPWILNL